MKYLPRTEVCALFEIRSPIWNGNAARREVGLAEYRIQKHNEIHFTYVRKSEGKKSIPESYYFDGDLLKSRDYERQEVKGTKLVIVPFDDLEMLVRQKPVEWLTPEELKEEYPNIHEVFFEDNKQLNFKEEL